MAEKAAQNLKKKYPGLALAGVHHGYFDKKGEENQKVIDQINKCSTDVLLVCFGMPLQERWLRDHWREIKAHIFLKGGAAFDYVSGRLKMAPEWMIRLGLEWLYRFFSRAGTAFYPLYFWKCYLCGEGAMSEKQTFDPRKKSLILGLLLLLVGLLARKGWVEYLFFPPGQGFDSMGMFSVLVVLRLLFLGLGIALVIKRPVFVHPHRGELSVVLGSVIVLFIILEVTTRLWLGLFASPKQVEDYALHTQIAAEDFRWSPHPYLGYFPTPGYQKGKTSHNSLGFRGPEFPLQKPSGIFRIVVLGGSTTYTMMVEDNAQTFRAQLERLLQEQSGNPRRNR